MFVNGFCLGLRSLASRGRRRRRRTSSIVETVYGLGMVCGTRILCVEL